MTPEVGTELVNPKAGTRTVFTATAESTGGAYVEVEATYPPRSGKPPLHLHPSQQEEFEVLTGAMTAIIGDETRSVQKGDTFVVPPALPHQMWNEGDEPAVLRWRTSPAQRTGEMFCELWACARDNDWEPDVHCMLSVLGEHEAEFRLC
jgi:mannose-6-phosphate isomerase-like protein (cupin superfamily)